MTAIEIDEGILKNSLLNNKCLAMIRKIDYDTANIELENKLKISGFLNEDMKDSQEQDSLIKKVKKALPSTNLIEYQVILFITYFI